MKKNVLTILFALLSVSNMFAGKVLESLKFQSNILKGEVKYSIYLPDGYDTSERSYPVLYLLHGWTDDETAWVQYGNVQQIADKTIQSQAATPMIIVMPDAGETWYVNSYDGKFCYEDMFFKELIPYIEKTYRVRTHRQYRAISGLSMGGYGSFLYTLHHPDYFSACAPLSAAVYTNEMIEKSKNDMRGKLFDKLYGKGNLTPHWDKNSVLLLMENLSAEEFPKAKFYIDCGDDDTLLHGNNIIHEIMQSKNIKHEFRVRDGGHTWTYWRTALPSVIEFVSRVFCGS